MTQINRRAILGATALAGFAPAGGAWAETRGLSPGVFTHSVASGDPLRDRVMLWTRFATPDGSVGRLAWEVAEDEAFTKVAARGAASASPLDDYCAKVDAKGLKPDGRYFYRFLSASGPSPVGRTRTAPAAGKAPFTLALFSCSNLPFGYFNAYAHAAAREDIDLCVHVGDYIYEYGRGTYPAAAEVVRGPALEPATEIVRLADYYQRYATYRADPDLQELHRLKPFATVWDDHELANDAWWTGAQNHQPDSEGAWVDRRAAAFKAYADWMPIRTSRAEPFRIYRSLDWGETASLLLLDTRLIGREQPLNWQAAIAPVLAEGEAAVARAVGALAQGPLADPKRTLLGAKQEAWLTAELARAKARGAAWAVLAQQVIFGRLLGSGGAGALLPDDASEGTRRFVGLSGQLGQAGLEFNLDAWGGYPAARARLIGAAQGFGPNVSILAGDSHNCWLNDIPGQGGVAAVEFAGGSVASPGLERTLSKAAEGAREALVQGANAGLRFADLTHRGYGVLRYTPARLEAEWIAMGPPAQRSPAPKQVTRFAVEAGAAKGWQAA